MNTEEYRSKLHNDIAIRKKADMLSDHDAFLKIVTDILICGEEFDDFTECYYEGVSECGVNMRIDGYSIDETDGSCCIFITDYHGPNDEISSVDADEITDSFKCLWYFIDEISKYEYYKKLEESTEAYDFAKNIYKDDWKITKFRFYLLTDNYNNQRNDIKELKIQNETVCSVANKPIELNVWDINRIFDLVNSKTQKTSIDISKLEFESMGNGIPCVKAAEYHDIPADIDPEYDEDSDIKQNEKSGNMITYESYLAVVPGQFLYDIYDKHGSRLLEGNVRSFLSARGKVNKKIQNTIKNYPEMFFAYNNGIAATATELDTEMTEKGLVITRIKDLQIVNGGQTTASIANTLYTKQKDEIIDLSKLRVPMKISVLEHSMSEKIIPKISEYSNSQNKIDASDFFSNHKFHIRMEKFSREIPAPAIDGNQYRQYWYYERARGQYNQEKMKFEPESVRMKEYEICYPENQVIKLVDLAKYMEIFYGNPHIVSKGKQAIVKNFANRIKEQWKISDTGFNEYYFKRMIAMAIMFRDTDNIIKSTGWYKAKRSYKANIIAYTLSIILNYIKVNKKGQINFAEIWNRQKVYPELHKQIDVLCKDVYEFITDANRPTENVTEWCKKEECWKRAQKQNWNILPDFIKTLVPEEEINSQKRIATEAQKTKKYEKQLKMIEACGIPYWEKVYEWGMQRDLLVTILDRNALKDIISVLKTGKTPDDRQADKALRAREKLIKEGMPLQFDK